MEYELLYLALSIYICIYFNRNFDNSIHYPEIKLEKIKIMPYQ
jgi:hypothetical protein